MTTNGIALNRKLPDLVRAGLNHLNISLDTLDELKFPLITRRPGLKLVLKSIDSAVGLLDKENYLESVKINTVLMRGVNEGEMSSFVDLTRNKPVTVRFIEYMPFDGLISFFFLIFH